MITDFVLGMKYNKMVTVQKIILPSLVRRDVVLERGSEECREEGDQEEGLHPDRVTRFSGFVTTDYLQIL